MFGEPREAWQGWVRYFFFLLKLKNFKIQNGNLHKNSFQSKKITILHDFKVLLGIYLIGMLE